jgi:hypothetical protein
MRDRFAAVAQRPVRVPDVVVASCVDLVRSNRFREDLHGAAVITGFLRHQTQKIQGLHMGGLAHENLTANLLRFGDAAEPVRTARRSGKVGNRDRCGEGEGAQARLGHVVSFAGRTSLSSIHVRSAGSCLQDAAEQRAEKAAIRGCTSNKHDRPGEGHWT